MSCSTAVSGRLSQPGSSKAGAQVLADRRSFNLATNFAGQWLRLRKHRRGQSKLQSFSGLRRQPEASLPAGTDLFFDSVLARIASVLTFIQGGLHVLNETPGEALGIPNVYGSRFRRVTLTPKAGAVACCGRAAYCR